MRFTQELYSDVKEVLLRLPEKNAHFISIYENYIVVEKLWGNTIIYSSLQNSPELNTHANNNQFIYKYDKFIAYQNGHKSLLRIINLYTHLPFNMIKVIIINSLRKEDINDKNLPHTQIRLTPDQVLQEIQGTWERSEFLQFTLNLDWIDVKFNYPN